MKEKTMDAVAQITKRLVSIKRMADKLDELMSDGSWDDVMDMCEKYYGTDIIARWADDLKYGEEYLLQMDRDIDFARIKNKLETRELNRVAQSEK